MSAPPDQALYALSAQQRRAMFAQLQAQARREQDSEAFVQTARDAGRLATASARLDGDFAQVARARRLLAAAAERVAVAGSCQAAIELARLSAGPGAELGAGYLAAAQAARRFAGAPGQSRCVRELSRIARTLRDYASAQQRAQVAPPSPGEEAGEIVTEDAVADWASRRRAPQPAGGASLQDVALYGGAQDAGAPRVDHEVRVVLRFDGVATYRRSELPQQGALPRRVVLDLDNARVAQRVPRVLPVGAGGLSRIRTFALDERTTRVSFDVRETTAYRLFFLTEPYRVVMDFRDRGDADGAVARPLTIVLDPGHGGEQPGAKGPHGLKESNVALSLARRVRKALLRDVPNVRVLMTRDDDVFITLEERTAIANGYGADLFVSIHLNASPGSDDKGGVATFVLDTTDDDAALRLAARENGTDTSDVTQLQFILASLYREGQVERSLSLAHEVQRATLAGGRRVLPRLYDRGVKRALFYVLVGARMPAVLVEASFITRPEEAKALHDDHYRDALAEGIAEGIGRYLAEQRQSARR